MRGQPLEIGCLNTQGTRGRPWEGRQEDYSPFRITEIGCGLARRQDPASNRQSQDFPRVLLRLWH